VSSMKPRVLSDGEIVGPDETFTWQVDGSLTERRRRRARRGRVWVAVAGMALALLILGIRTELFSSVAAGQW
jgi:hypothetical protein